MNKYVNRLSIKNRIGRMLWSIIYFILFKPFSLRLFNTWRIFLLKLFGAKVTYKSSVYSSAKIWAPWNLEINEYSTIGPNVDCYNVDKIIIGKYALVSQKAYLCTASHDYEHKDFKLITAPIKIKDYAWIGASAYINMGVTIETGTIVGATASVYKSTEEWVVVGGNPAKTIKKRKLE